jgi:hypothetical protein
MTYPWRAGDFRAMAGNLLLPFRTGERCQRFAAVDVTGSGFAPRKIRVSRCSRGLTRFAAGGRWCCRFDPSKQLQTATSWGFSS